MDIRIEGLDEIITAVGGDNMSAVNAALSQEMTDYVRQWYTQRGNDYFDNPALPTHGAGRKDTNWAQGIAERWEPGDSTPDSFSIVFNEGGDRYGLALKIKGGTVSAIAAPVANSAIISDGLLPRRFISGNSAGATVAMSETLDPEMPETRNSAPSST